MLDLSCDILHCIFAPLPAESLVPLRAVCKAWKHAIDDPFFVKSHTKAHHSHSHASSILVRDRNGGGLFSLSLDRLNYATDVQQALHVIPLKQLIHRGMPRLGPLPAPSCNGLILLSHRNIKKSWAIWNPLLQSFHELLPPPADNDYGSLARCGFGYDEATDDYKVVRVDRLCRNVKGDDPSYRSLVYSLRSRCWSAIEGFPAGDCLGHRGAFLNGRLHWGTRRGIIALDLGEGHRHRLLPRPQQSVGQISPGLEALDGCLILSYCHENFRGMDAWVMKDYGTWTKLFSLGFQPNTGGGVSVVAYLKSKAQVILRRHYQPHDTSLLWLDLNHNSAKRITIYGHAPAPAPAPLTFAQFYPGSLLRLHHTKNRRGVKRKERRVAWFPDDTLNYL